MKEIMENWRKAVRRLDEGGFLRVHRMLLGMVPSVDEVGILTAWNPNAEELSREENNQRNLTLFRGLKLAGYGPIKIKGKFGNFERSFLIPHMSREDAVSAGREHGQAAVIWGKKIEDEEGNVKMVFQYIEDDQTMDTRDVALVGAHKYDEEPPEDIQARKDYYSEKAGRKFVIPFFDERWEFEVDEGALDEVLLKENIPDTRSTKILLKKIEERKKKLAAPNASKKYYWHHRCIMREYSQQLKKLLI